MQNKQTMKPSQLKECVFPVKMTLKERDILRKLADRHTGGNAAEFIRRYIRDVDAKQTAK